MTDVKQDGIFSLSTPVVMSFPALFEARAFKKKGKETGEAKFSASFVFDAGSAELKEMKTLAAQLARAKWPTKPFSELVFPFTSGDKAADDRKAKGKDDGEWTRGKIILSSRSKYAPRLSVIENGRLIELDSDLLKEAHKAKFYNGAEVLAQFNLVAYEGVGQNKGGVTAYLNMVLSTNKGARLSGGQSASEAFKGYVGSVSTTDPTGGAPGAGAALDDEIIF